MKGTQPGTQPSALARAVAFLEACWARFNTKALESALPGSALALLLWATRSQRQREDALCHDRQPARLSEHMQPCRPARLPGYQGIPEKLHPPPLFWMDNHLGAQRRDLFYALRIQRGRTSHGEADEEGIQHPNHRLFHPSQSVCQRLCRQDDTRCTMVVPQPPLPAEAHRKQRLGTPDYTMLIVRCSSRLSSSWKQMGLFPSSYLPSGQNDPLYTLPHYCGSS